MPGPARQVLEPYALDDRPGVARAEPRDPDDADALAEADVLEAFLVRRLARCRSLARLQRIVVGPRVMELVDQVVLLLGNRSTLYIPAACAVTYWIWAKRREALLGGPVLAGAMTVYVITRSFTSLPFRHRTASFVRS